MNGVRASVPLPQCISRGLCQFKTKKTIALKLWLLLRFYVLERLRYSVVPSEPIMNQSFTTTLKSPL